MDTNNQQKRRASESEALALVSNVNRIPPPLPYLPSDYMPSAESPRHFLVSRRQRSRSIGHPLAIEHNSSASSSAQQHYELVPYRELTVIARNSQKGQMVLYNQDNQSVTVQHYFPDHHFDPSIPIQLDKDDDDDTCPFCHGPINRASTSKPKVFEPDYMDRNYFRLLASSQSNTATNSPAQSRSSTFTTSGPQPTSQNLNENAFNQGYYSKFFVEINKLGKGFRGSVFLCEHMLDGVKLGKYAIKKVAIGNNHPWLVRMLREVHLLERLRHPNIVSYKHSWLEYNRLTPFGPEVPCLFILMECANGGNLEEYFEQSIPQPKEKRRMSSVELKRERIKKQLEEQENFEQEADISSPVTTIHNRLLTMTEIWSLFLDIVQGLAHLHQQNIVHRDLKPPNLLLQYDDRQRGIPRVLISDFGECEDLDEAGQLNDDNRTGATGTLEFMAPEHVKLDLRGRNTVDYSPKADMWSLGMVLYYLCYSRLPYTVIDDVDILRQEILSFKDVLFPVSRFDIYDHHSTVYNDAVNNPNLQTDIPGELKMLIRMLLSLEPSKRPSCKEILSKLPRIQQMDSVYHNGSSSNSSSHASSPSPKSPTVVVEEAKEEQRARSASPSKRSTNDTGLRKRQRLLPVENGDTAMTDEPEGLVSQQPPQQQHTPLLLGSAESSNDLQTNKHSILVIKTATAVLKIASCSWSCSPYSTKASILYPVLFFALLDFWTETASPSFLLLILHVVWIMSTTLFSGGLCEA